MTTPEQQGLLLGLLKAVPGVNEVRAYPVHKLLSEDIFKDLPSLKLPAILLSFRQDERTGSQVQIIYDWSAVLVTKDLKGEAETVMLGLADGVREKVTAKQLASRLVARDESDLTMIDSGREFCVGVLNFSTRAY